MIKSIIRILAQITMVFAVSHNARADRFHRPVRWAVVAALAVAVVCVFAPLSQRAYAVSTQTPWQKLTQSQLTAVWWKWALSIPVSDNPLFDDTGAKAYNGQPHSDLLFLGGTFTVTELVNGDVLGKVTRSISVKQGTAFFFPLLNSEIDNVCGRPRLGGPCFPGQPFPNNLGVPKLGALAAAMQDTATGLYARLTPTNKQFIPTGPAGNVVYARLRSPPFSFTLPKTDNIYQFFAINVTGTVAPAVADGYYSLIPGTLAPGCYLLEFGGTLPISATNVFRLEITYRIIVTP